MNNKQATITGILACGYVEDYGRSTKYRIFEPNQDRTIDGHVPKGSAEIGPLGRPLTLMVGKAGAFRLTEGPLSDSWSATDSQVHKAYQYVGRMFRQNFSTERSRELVSMFLAGRFLGHPECNTFVVETIDTTPSNRQFHNFADCVNMSDAIINGLLRQLQNKFFAGKKYHSISAGDTLVTMLAWENSVDFVVSNSCGYSRAIFQRGDDDFTELKNWKPEYERPLTTPVS